MDKHLHTHLDSFQQALQQATTEQDIRLVYARYLGKEGMIRTAFMTSLQQAAPADKKKIGQEGNVLLQQAEKWFTERLQQYKQAVRAQELARRVDVTLPGRAHRLGKIHPLTQVRRDVESIFAELGFSVATGPQIETEFYNFEALAMPAHHPARSLQDTFYLQGERWLLRTHTSSVQIRAMLQQKPPVRIIAPGKVYRNEDDKTHSPQFSQMEGLCVDKGITFADLKGTLLHFVHRFFGKETHIRLRASYFPFVNPGAEVDISCSLCKGQGCRTCKGTGYLEVLGCGMVDPEVFRQVGYDAYDCSGFAFGMGLDRLAMLRHGVDDLKLFFSGDLRVTEQLGS